MGKLSHALYVMIILLFVFLQSCICVAEEGDKERDSRTFFAIPVASYADETGFAGGAAVLKSYHRDRLRVSTLQSLVMYTEKKQFVTVLVMNHYLRNGLDRFYMKAGYMRYPTEYFGLGNDTKPDDPDKYTPEVFEINPFFDKTLYRSLKIRPELFFVQQTLLETKPDSLFADNTARWSSGRMDLGPALSLVWDSRDNTLASRSGTYFRITYRGIMIQDEGDAYNSFAGEFRHFWEPRPLLVFASMLYTRHTRGDTPFYLKPTLGGGDYLRGYEENRFIGDSVALIQQDIRFPIWWRIGGSVFAATGRVADDASSLFEGQYHFGYGTGLRFFINRDDNMVIRFDMAWGNDTDTFYAGFGEAF